MRLDGFRHFVLDLDGTLYKSGRWLDGAQDFLRALRESGRDYVLLTNNSSHSHADYIKKLADMGLSVPRDRLITSGEAAIYYLKKHHLGQSVCLLGNERLKREFKQAGIPLRTRKAEIAMTAFDTSLTYAKLHRFCDLVRGGATYLATHPDVNCPTQDGLMPDIGAIHAFVQASTGRLPDTVIGKPHAPICELLFDRTGWRKSQTAAVGDRLTTDVALAKNHGFAGILVLSGATSRADLADVKDLKDEGIKPDYVFESVREMVGWL